MARLYSKDLIESYYPNRAPGIQAYSWITEFLKVESEADPSAFRPVFCMQETDALNFEDQVSNFPFWLLLDQMMLITRCQVISH